MAGRAEQSEASRIFSEGKCPSVPLLLLFFTHTNTKSKAQFSDEAND